MVLQLDFDVGKRDDGKVQDVYKRQVNPFRASIVLGTPGSGKSYAVVNNFIKQQIEKGFRQYIYDFKYPDLSTIAYNHLLNHPDGYNCLLYTSRCV